MIFISRLDLGFKIGQKEEGFQRCALKAFFTMVAAKT
jgi:hypothetical protein